MKLILTQEVSGLGSPGDVVDVRDGYGRNYLLPRGFAIQWTRGAQKQIEAIRRARHSRDIRDLDSAREVAERVGSRKVRLPRRTGEGGRLFGSVTAADVASGILDSGGPELDKRRIEVRHPIKSVGEHQVSVRLHPEVSTTITVEVVPA